MKEITVLGHFAYGRNLANGQTIKTKVVTEAMREHFGADSIKTADTHGGWRFLLRLPFIALHTLFRSRHIVMMPGPKGVLAIIPVFLLFNLFFRRKIHYVVIGGWLPSHAKKNSIFRTFLRHIDHIYLETTKMKKSMDAMHLDNTCVMPNCKKLDIVSSDYVNKQNTPPYLLCTFSRVIKEKGIEDAVSAVNECNRRMGKAVFHLHIYGQVEEPEWFDALMKRLPAEIQYKGLIAHNDSTRVLKDYFALLFPTYYHGEAFAGTLIDALAAGLPVIASDWHDNPELVIPDETGILFPVHSVGALTDILLDVAHHPQKLNDMRSQCIKRAHNYLPEIALQPLFGNLS